MRPNRCTKAFDALTSRTSQPSLAVPGSGASYALLRWTYRKHRESNTLLFGSSGPDFRSDNQDSLPKFLFSLQVISGSKPHSCAHHPKTTNEIASQPQQHLHKRQEQKKNNNDITEATTTIQEQQQQQHCTTINEMTNEIASEQQH